MPETAEMTGGDYRGWWLGFGLIVVILVIGAAIWFHYHP
jgi:disulfide bond formation protein DsbB